MNDRRMVWLSVASLVGAIGGGALVEGIAAQILSLWITGLFAIAAAVLVFTSLLRGWPFGSLAKTDAVLPSAFSERVEEAPAFMLPIFASNEQEMQQLAPYSWLSGYGPKDPEVTLRAAVALPAVSAMAYSGELATVIRGEQREGFLLDLLETSEFTKWLRAIREFAPGIAESRWQVRGGSFAELTELVFAPSVESNQMWPFLARCAVLTGWRTPPNGLKRKAIRFIIEAQLNPLLFSKSQVNDVSDGQEAKRLTLEEIAKCFVGLTESLNLSSKVAEQLITGADVSVGYYALWFTVRGHMLEQVVDLSGVNRLAEAISRNDATATGSWESADGPVNTTWGKVIADMLDHLLEGAGYRGVGNRFDWLR